MDKDLREIVIFPIAVLFKQIFWKFWDIAKDYIEEGKKLQRARKLKLERK